MRFVKQEETKMKFEKVVVTVLAVGKGLDGKTKDKTVRQQYQSFEVQDARPEEVAAVITRALEAASGKGK